MDNFNEAYQKPIAEFVTLVPEEVVAMLCWRCTAGGSLTC